jgi:hypothetical protein
MKIMWKGQVYYKSNLVNDNIYSDPSASWMIFGFKFSFKTNEKVNSVLTLSNVSST